jgi:hypothetical protein
MRSFRKKCYEFFMDPKSMRLAEDLCVKFFLNVSDCPPCSNDKANPIMTGIFLLADSAKEFPQVTFAPGCLHAFSGSFSPFLAVNGEWEKGP